MARGEPQQTVTRLVVEILHANIVGTPAWLLRPGRNECGRHWDVIRSIYEELTELELPEKMPPRETRRVDAVLRVDDAERILEIDEKQHFNGYRALTLRRYPKDVRVAFPVEKWVEASERKRSLEKGGFGRPCPPLFPGEAGRHRQRAFRDALADLLAGEHDHEPTLRFAHFEVEPWIYGDGAKEKLRTLLEDRL
jgi:hypothetical protein